VEDTDNDWVEFEPTEFSVMLELLSLLTAVTDVLDVALDVEG
jgi:hypothetical protein